MSTQVYITKRLHNLSGIQIKADFELPEIDCIVFKVKTFNNGFDIVEFFNIEQDFFVSGTDYYLYYELIEGLIETLQEYLFETMLDKDIIDDYKELIETLQLALTDINKFDYYYSWS